MKKGETVKQIVPVITGEIIEVKYDEQAEQLRHLVEYHNADGAVHQRWFMESELEYA